MGGRPGLASRTALVTTGVAAIAILLVGVVTVGLVRRTGDQDARTQLGAQADIVAAELAATPGASAELAVLRAEGVRAVRLNANGEPRGNNAGARLADLALGLRAADVQRLQQAGRLSLARQLARQRVFIEVRTAPKGYIALIRPVSATRNLVNGFVRRLLLALLIGLVFAAGAGILLARRLARPLQHAAGAARRLAGGQRGERLVPEGPAEVAAVAEALNVLAAGLETSEGRQREFLLSISHELRTPLTAIRGFAEALADGVTTGADVPAAGGVVLDEAVRLDRLVSDLLDLARLGAQDFRIDPAPVDLSALLADAARVWESRCSAEDVGFRFDAPPGPLRTTTDGGRVRQIVDGLTENALRVTPSGQPIVLGLRRDGDWAVIEVRDGGPGLTPDDCAVAFERSALYDRYRGVRRVGTGVGLALVAGLTARLGGLAEAGSAPEGGARFTIRLPIRA